MSDTAGTAAADLGIAVDDRPSAYPQDLAGFANRSSGNYVDQTGGLRYARTGEQMQQDRADWIAQFDRNKTAAGYMRGEDMTKFSDEARAAHIAKFDAAAAADGYNTVEPPAPELQRHADLHLIPLNPKSTDYTPQLGEHAAHAGEMTSLAAEIGFASSVGAAFLERLVAVSEQKKSMTPEALTFWAGQQRADLLRRAGGDERALAEQVDRVVGELQRVRGTGSKLAAAIADDAVLSDWYLFTTLLNHSRARTQFEATRPDRRR
jgi:hypothetical protein